MIDSSSDELGKRLQSVQSRIATACDRAGRSTSSITLVAVTKTVTTEVAKAIFELGVHHLGENRPQELWKKAAALPDATWHFIGHMQRNKLDKSLPLVSLVHSVDSVRLLDAIAAFGTKRGSPVSILLEVNCSREPAKGGFAPEMLPSLTVPEGVKLEGLMTMAAAHDDAELCRPAFVELRQLRDALQQRLGYSLPHLSMGMSNDFEIAIEEGATLIRLGSVLFEGFES